MEIEKRIAKIPQQLNQFFGEFLEPYANGNGFLENRLEKISQEIRKGIISLCIEMVWIESSLKETFSKNLMLKTSPYVERIVSIMDDLVDNKIDKKDVEEVISDLELPLMKIIVQETIEHSVKIMAANDTFLKRVNKIWETSDLNLDLRLRKAFLLFLTLQFDPTVN